LLAQLFFVEAGLPQLSTPCSGAVVITAIAIIVVAIPGADIDTPRSDLNTHLREGYSWKNKRNGSKNTEDVCAHGRLPRARHCARHNKIRINLGKRLLVGVADDEGGVGFLDGLGRRLALKAPHQ
jgi:hypothetical protein